MRALYPAALATLSFLAGTLAWSHPGGHGLEAPDAPKSPPRAPVDWDHGRPGDPAKVTRTLTLELKDDQRIEPSQWTVKQGETVKFVARNSAKAAHRVVLATQKELKDQSALVKKFPALEVRQPNQVQVQPGQTGEFVWQFTRAGDFSIGSPEHLDRGMVAKVTVTAP